MTSFWKPEACSQTGLPDKALLVGQKLAGNAKIWKFKCDILSDFQTLWLITEPKTAILGGPDIHLKEGSTMNLTCIITDSPEPPSYIFWRHDDAVSLFSLMA